MMMSASSCLRVCGATTLLLLTGCANRSVATVQEGPGDDVGYDENTDVVVAGGTTWVIHGDPGDECLMVGDQCLDINEIKAQYCGDPNAQADIVVVEGKVVEVICYPPRESGVSIESATVNEEGQTVLPQNAGHVVITFPAESNGKPIHGDVRLDAEQVALIGNGIDQTIIDGNLEVASNGARVRGLTVLGNVRFAQNANESSIAFCKIHGNLVIESNGVSVVSCLVFGNIEVKGNGAVLVQNGVQGNLTGGKPTVCKDNYSFADKSGNFLVEPGEMGAPLECKGPQ